MSAVNSRGSAVASVVDLTKSYGRHRVIENASFTLTAGSVHVLIGPNGAGKSTLVRMLAGLARPDAGVVQVLGAPAGSRGGDVGVLFEDPNLYPHLSGAENLRLLAGRSTREPLPARWLEVLGLGEPMLRQRGRSYSFGQRRRITLCALLWRSPPLVLLDEPTNGLDPDGTRAFRDYVDIVTQTGDVTLLVTGQDLASFDEIAETVLVLRSGQLSVIEKWQQVRAGLGSLLTLSTTDPAAVHALLLEHSPAESVAVVERAVLGRHAVELRGGADQLRDLAALALAECGPLVSAVNVRPTDLDEVYRGLQRQES